MPKKKANTKQLSVAEINELIADFKAWVDDARKARSADKLSEHLKRLAFLSTKNSALKHVITFGLPRVDVSSFVKRVNDSKPDWYGRSVPIEWPIDPDERLAMHLAILIVIGEEQITLWSLLQCSFGSFDDLLTEMFVPATRDFDRLLKRMRQEGQSQASEGTVKSKQLVTTKRQFSLDLFISHSSKDEHVAKRLIEFLRAALAIPHERVRCTSVDGYKLSAGVPTELELKREIHESRCFIGLVTPNSLQSSFVLFELGARWGSGARLIPVLARQKASDLRPPLSNLNALSCQKSQEMHQLVHELARELGKRVPLPASYDSQLNALLEVAGTQSAQTPTSEDSMGLSGGNERAVSAQEVAKATAFLAEHDNRWYLDFAKHFYPDVNQAVKALLSATSFETFAQFAGAKIEMASPLDKVKSRLEKEGFTSRNETFSGVSLEGKEMVSKPKSIYGIHGSGAVLMCPTARRTFDEIHQKLLGKAQS